MIVGICRHGEILSMALECASREALEDMAAAYRLERRTDATFGNCAICKDEYDANIRLLDSLEGK